MKAWLIRVGLYDPDESMGYSRPVDLVLVPIALAVLITWAVWTVFGSAIWATFG